MSMFIAIADVGQLNQCWNMNEERFNENGLNHGAVYRFANDLVEANQLGEFCSDTVSERYADLLDDVVDGTYNIDAEVTNIRQEVAKEGKIIPKEEQDKLKKHLWEQHRDEVEQYIGYEIYAVDAAAPLAKGIDNIYDFLDKYCKIVKQTVAIMQPNFKEV